jgi:hypothetical protein
MKENLFDSFDSVICPPDPVGTFESMRAYGYNFSEAISDIIDNSISAEAKNVWIKMVYKKEDSWIRIADDGKGMDNTTLISAMTIGKKPDNNCRNAEDHGRFGFGLKTASISQAKRLSVRTKNQSKSYQNAVWDLDEVSRSGWKLFLAPLDNKSDERLGSIAKTGTIVLWEKLDRLIQNNSFKSKSIFESLGKNLNILLGCRYHRFIQSQKLNIYFNDLKINFFDPFQLPTLEFKDLGKSSYGNIKVQALLLPHESKFKGKPKDLDYANGFKGIFDHQGIYLYRNNRLMIIGDWLNSGVRKSEVGKLLRIKIDIDNSNDEEWRIDVRKCNAMIPDSLLSDLNRLILASKEEAKKRYTFRVAKSQKKNSENSKEEFIEIWSQNVTRNGTSYKINKGHPLIKSVKEAILLQSKTKIQGLAITKLLDSMLVVIENMAKNVIGDSIAVFSESIYVPEEPFNNEEVKKKETKLMSEALGALGYNDVEIKEILLKSIKE